MAAQITHIVLAKEFLKRYPIAGSERDFIVGASFPDIRYLGTVKREVTHDLNVDLRDILNAPDGFSAGVRHHVLTDIVRNRFVLGHHAYSSVPNDKYLTEAFKFLEDEMLYGRLDDPQDAAKMFGEVLEPERAYGLADDEIVRWHARLSEYVSQAPSPATRRTTETDFDDLIQT